MIDLSNLFSSWNIGSTVGLIGGIVGIIGGSITIWRTLFKDKPILTVEPETTITQMFEVPNPNKENPAKRYVFCASIYVFNEGLRDTSVKSYKLKLRKEDNTYIELNPTTSVTWQWPEGRNFTFGIKDSKLYGQNMLIKSQTGLIDTVMFESSFGAEPSIGDEFTLGEFILFDALGKSTSCNLKFQKVSSDTAPRVVPKAFEEKQ